MAAVDCGIQVNPEIVHAQVESGIIYSLSAATKAAATIKNGAMEQNNVHDLPVIRINEIPKTEVHLLNRSKKTTKIGVIGVPGISFQQHLQKCYLPLWQK